MWLIIIYHRRRRRHHLSAGSIDLSTASWSSYSPNRNTWTHVTRFIADQSSEIICWRSAILNVTPGIIYLHSAYLVAAAASGCGRGSCWLACRCWLAGWMLLQPGCRCVELRGLYRAPMIDEWSTRSLGSFCPWWATKDINDRGVQFLWPTTQLLEHRQIDRYYILLWPSKLLCIYLKTDLTLAEN